MPSKLKLTNPLTVCLLAAIACALWGSAAPMIKIGYELFSIAENDTWTIILFAGMRFFLAGVLVILFSSLIGRKPDLPKKSSWGNVTALALTQTVGQYILYYIGVANSSGVHSAILTGAANLWAILLACYLFRQEKMTLPKLLGCVLGFGGIILMNFTGEGSGVTLMGEGMLLLSGMCSGVATGQTKNYSRTESPITLTGWQFLLGGAIMILCSLTMGARLETVSIAGFGALTYLGSLSAIAYTIWTVLIKHNSVSGVVIYGFMTPMFGVLWSALLLGEVSQAFSGSTLAALLMVCAGIICVNAFRKGTKSHKSM